MSDEKRRGVLTTALVCLLVIVCFGLLKRPDNTNEPEYDNTIKSTDTYKPASQSSEDTARSYTLRLEEGNLRLYLNSEKESIFLEAFPINEALFPEEDIVELKSGITLSGLEKSIGIIEDFTS